VREGQKSEWVREKDRERRERGGQTGRSGSGVGRGGQEPEGETHIQNPNKHGLTFSLAS
jgi:hypothetical protein